MNSGPNRTRRIILWGSSLPALLAASFLYHPFAFTGPVLCPMALVLGMPCPGCGLTRALCLMTHGEFSEALAWHGLAPFVLAYLGFLWIFKIVEEVRGTPPRLPVYRIGAVSCFIVVGFWLLRLVVFFAHGGLSLMAHDNLLSRILRLLECK